MGVAFVVFVLVQPPQRTAGPNACSAGPHAEQVMVYFDDDADMRAAAKQMRDDGRIAALDTETKRESWERFKRRNAYQPEVIKLANPEASGASLWLLPAGGTSPADLARQMYGEFPRANGATSVSCPLPTTAERISVEPS